MHSFNIEHAARYGVEGACLLEYLRHWIGRNRTEGRHFHDGRWWTYNSAARIAEALPYLSASQVDRGMDKLVKAGVILRQYGLSPEVHNRTSWFAFSDETAFLGGEAIERVEASSFHETAKCPDEASPFHGSANCESVKCPPEGAISQISILQNRDAISRNREMPLDNKDSVTGPITEHASQSFFGARAREVRLEAERLRNEVGNLTIQYLRTLETKENRDKIIDAFEFHLNAGHALTVESYAWAVGECIRSWQANGIQGTPKRIDPVLAKLAERINPFTEAEISDETERSAPAGGPQPNGGTRPPRRSGSAGDRRSRERLAAADEFRRALNRDG